MSDLPDRRIDSYKKRPTKSAKKRRVCADEFKQEAVLMLLDGHLASSIVQRLGISGTNLLYRWKQQQLDQTESVSDTLDARVAENKVVTDRVHFSHDGTLQNRPGGRLFVTKV